MKTTSRCELSLDHHPNTSQWRDTYENGSSSHRTTYLYTYHDIYNYPTKKICMKTLASEA